MIYSLKWNRVKQTVNKMINKLNLKYKCCKKQYGEGKGQCKGNYLKGKNIIL